MKDPYHCPYSSRSTRRWNLQVHIKRKHGGSPGQYPSSQPFSYKDTNPYHNMESTTVSDNGWNTFQYGPQQAPQYSASPIYPPTPMMDDRSHGRGLSPETILKIEQMKRLVYKYPQYQNNDPDGIIRWAIYNSSNGDNTLLDNKLEQLRVIDSRLNGWS